MTRPNRSLVRLLCLSLLVMTLAACGNNSPVPPPPEPNPTPSPTPTPPPGPSPIPGPTPVPPPGPTPPPVTATLSGTWSGTTTTQQFGTEQTSFTLTDTGGQVSGTLTLTDSSGGSFDTNVTGTVSGTAATVSGVFPLQEGSEVEYRYEGTFSETTYSGTVTLLVAGSAQGQGQFSVTKAGGAPGPTPGPTPTPGSDTISGTVSASGGDVLGTAVLACTADFSTCEYGVAVEASGSSAPYTIPGVPSGSYAVAAFNDVDGNQELSEGDLFGIYTTDGQTPAAVTPPATGIDITMSVLTAEANSVAAQALEGLNLPAHRNTLKVLKPSVR